MREGPHQVRLSRQGRTVTGADWSKTDAAGVPAFTRGKMHCTRACCVSQTGFTPEALTLAAENAILITSAADVAALAKLAQ